MIQFSRHGLVPLLLLLLLLWVSPSTAFFGGSRQRDQECQAPCVPGDESIMRPKAHGTSNVPVMKNLRWGCDWDTADRIANFNRHYAERSGYWETTSFLSETSDPEFSAQSPITFYDSNTGKPLYRAPMGRSWQEFLTESRNHGWPSFRDDEVVWDHVRVLPNGETVSVDGTHLGHNLPDKKGNRYCINLVCIAGNPLEGRKLERQAGRRHLLPQNSNSKKRNEDSL